MLKAGLDVTINANIQAVWAAVTGYEDIGWKSGVEKMVVVDDGHLVEYTENGLTTHIYIMEKRPGCLYEYKMTNRRLSGLWTGRFFELPDGRTLLRILEEVHVRHFWHRILFALTDRLGRGQRRYATELKHYLEISN